jgi:hypothetical protein
MSVKVPASLLQQHAGELQACLLDRDHGRIGQ